MTPTERAARLARVSGLYAIVDDAQGRRHDLGAVLEGALAAGVGVVQLRLKQTRDGEALQRARWAVERAHAAGALLIVNDRLDLASLAGADGVHLGADDLAPECIPTELRRELLIGLSTHTLDQVRASRSEPVDYIGFGPVFGTRSKTSVYDARGAAALSRAVEASSRPVVAIGGIDAERLPQIRGSGVAAVAVISALADADDPAQAARSLRRLLPPAAPAGDASSALPV